MPFLESNDALGHSEELRARMDRDGYLFFRDLINPDAILQVRRDILALCRDAGWLAEGSDLMAGVAAPGVRHVEPEPDYMGVYDQVMGRGRLPPRRFPRLPQPRRPPRPG